MDKVKLSSPWEIFFSEIEELFCRDPEVDLKIDHDAKTIQLFIANSAKADALAKILPEKKAFGDIDVKIEVVPANDADDPISLFERAFFGNPVFEYAVHEGGDGAYEATYVVFENRVVQFYCDNLADLYRNRSTLYEEIARDVFGDMPVCFCTDMIDDEEELPFF